MLYESIGNSVIESIKSVAVSVITLMKGKAFENKI